MRLFFRILAAASLLLLAGCGAAPGGSPAHRSVAGPPMDEIAASRNLSFVVSGGADPVLREAAERFAEKLEEITEGGLAVEVSFPESAESDFLAGEAELAFLDGGTASDPNGDFALLSGVMRYSDYEMFTMGLNSAGMLETLNDRLRNSGIQLLAAFYQGSGQLVADRGSVGGELRGDPIQLETDGDTVGEDELIDYEDLIAAVAPGSVAFPLLERYGMSVSEAEGTGERAALISDGEVNVAEFSADELENIMLPAGLYYLATSHSASPLWLAVRPSVFRALPEEYRAAMEESCAYLFPLVDEYYLGRDVRIAERLRMQGLLEESKLGGLRDAAAQLLEENPPADPVHQYMLRLLSELS